MRIKGGMGGGVSNEQTLNERCLVKRHRVIYIVYFSPSSCQSNLLLQSNRSAVPSANSMNLFLKSVSQQTNSTCMKRINYKKIDMLLLETGFIL